MWPWKHSRPDRTLEERLEKVEKTLGGIELEWADTYDRMRTLMGRISKRAEILARKEAQDAPGSTDDGGSAPDPYANLDPTTRAIFERRGMIPKRR